MAKHFLFLIFLLLNCAQSNKNALDSSSEIEVNFYPIICIGEGFQWCLQVKNTRSKNWQFQYDPIEGLNYQWGYRYFLNIDKVEVENPPQDASAIKWVLKAILKKEKVAFNTVFKIDLNGVKPVFEQKTNSLVILDKHFTFAKKVNINSLSKATKITFQIMKEDRIEVVEIN
jgi:Domain of unknown function (DUF4377)